MIFQQRLLLVCPLFLVLACGCGTTGSAPASVHGKVTYNGQPVKGGTVTFIGSGTYQLPIDKDGNYAGRDLPIGDLVVTVETESAKPKENGQKQRYVGGQGQDAMKGAETMQKMLKKGGQAVSQPRGEYVKIPRRYSNPKETPLKFNVTKGDQKIDLELTGEAD
jgi:hypothetical protein